MGRKKLSMSEKIRQYVQANPDAKSADVAAALGVKLSLVYAVRKYKSKKANNVRPTATVHEPVQIKVDLVNHPPHYTHGGIETIDFIAAKLTKEEYIGYLKGSVLKYGSRIGKKGDANIDAGKLAWYASRLNDAVAV